MPAAEALQRPTPPASIVLELTSSSLPLAATWTWTPLTSGETRLSAQVEPCTTLLSIRAQASSARRPIVSFVPQPPRDLVALDERGRSP